MLQPLVFSTARSPGWRVTWLSLLSSQRDDVGHSEAEHHDHRNNRDRPSESELVVLECSAVPEKGHGGAADAGTTDSHHVDEVESLEGTDDAEHPEDVERRADHRKDNLEHQLERRGTIHACCLPD